MKKIGIIGGLGPEATIDYYREIIGFFNNNPSNGKIIYPEIIIYSVNMWEFLQLLTEKKFEQATDFIVNYLNKLKDAGADFAIISANTPHLLFNQYKAKTDIPLISIVECCRKRAVDNGLKRCGLLGTKFTMKADFYKNSYHKNGIEVFSPDEKEIELINEKLFTEIELGIFKDETKKMILDIVQRMKDRHHIDSVILGCTEFPLIFKEEKYLEIPFLNTTRIHVEKIIQECLG
jgi:aspartate racemase